MQVGDGDAGERFRQEKAAIGAADEETADRIAASAKRRGERFSVAYAPIRSRGRVFDAANAAAEASIRIVFRSSECRHRPAASTTLVVGARAARDERKTREVSR